MVKTIGIASRMSSTRGAEQRDVSGPVILKLLAMHFGTGSNLKSRLTQLQERSRQVLCLYTIVNYTNISTLYPKYGCPDPNRLLPSLLVQRWSPGRITA